MGRVYVVNENDEIIDLKERSELLSTDITQCSILWLTDSQSNVLMAKRSKNKNTHPGLWSIASGGMVDEGEDYDVNIVKETEEEIGLTLDPSKLTKGEKIRTYEFPAFMQWYFYTADVPIENFVLQEEEVDEVKWYSPEELREDLKNNPNKFTPISDYWSKKFL